MQKNKGNMTAKVIVYGALFAALAAVLGQLLAIRPTESMKFTLDKCVLFLSGMFFGPVVGGMVGFAADFAGGMLFGRGFTPWLCFPAIFYGVCGGLFRGVLAKKFTVLRLALCYLVPTAIGAVAVQSVALAWTYGPFWEMLAVNLGTRSVQFAIMLVLEVAIIYFLIKTKIFTRAGLWPPVNKNKRNGIMTAQEAIAYIESVSWKGTVPGLGRTQKLLELMGNPEKQLKYVHVAGTNGKGSTCAMVTSILRKAGYNVGLYTSPHIYCFNERIQINGENITDAELAAATEYVRPLAQSMVESPTEFELVFCIAVECFRRRGCDIVVTEVGMGGALDATNVIPAPEVAVIANIGLDHTEFLGDTVEAIAAEKAGIFKAGSSAVIYPSGASVEAVLEGVCKEKNIPCRKADFDSIISLSHSLEGQTFDCGNRKELFLPLLGQHQLHNCCVALNAVDALREKGWNITEEQIRQGLADTVWPGRFHIMGYDPLFIIDGGHNPQCFEALVKNIEDYLAGKRIIGLTGVLADKDYGDMYKSVLPMVQEFVCITPPTPRKLEAALLAEHLGQHGAKATPCDTIAQGVALAKELAGADGVVLCFGSLYSIGEIQKAYAN